MVEADLAEVDVVLSAEHLPGTLHDVLLGRLVLQLQVPAAQLD